MESFDRPASLAIFDTIKHAAIRGWEECKIAAHSMRGYVNQRVGLLELWVTVMKPDGKGGEKLCYEQPKFFENLGVIVLIEDDQGRLVFVKNFRQVGNRLPEVAPARYVQALTEQSDLLEKAVASLGCWQWELPQGSMMRPTAEQVALSEREFMFEVARCEAREEAGCEITDLRFVGWLHKSTAYIAHPWAVVRARLALQGEQHAEEHEFLGNVERFTPGQIRERIIDGSIASASMLGALLLAGIQIPPAPRG